MNREITRRLEFDNSPERVWKAITDPEEIAAWFGDTAKLDLKPGGDGEFGWKNHGKFAVRVEVVEPPTRLAWRWAKDTGVAIENGPSTLVEWTLTRRQDGGTILDLRESGFEEDEHFESNTGGWKAELGELVDFLKG